jgi:asparagine synthase (glutamine-hydrolysing)
VCGIAGILAFEHSDQIDLGARLERMVRAIDHRGPDGVGSWSAPTSSGGRILLGHSRLAILDLTPAAAQPMERNRSVVTFNGEIYNFKDLRAELAGRGHQFRTSSDTEALLASMAEWGDDGLHRLSGMFAFGLWDGLTERLRLVRDRFGIKPLYYAIDNRALVFASEVRALLASGLVPGELDDEAVWHYLGYQTTPTPKTLIRGVRMLAPGETLDVTSDGTSRGRRYWGLLDAAAQEPMPASRHTAIRTIRERLHSAVREHLVSDVPVAAFLSGGVDSGALVSVLASVDVRPRTFTVSLADAALDESAGAAATARHFEADHTAIRLDGRDLAEELPEILGAVDHPSGDGINTYVVSREVSRHGLKVALSGLGGDEIFGGYDSFRRLRAASSPVAQIARVPAGVRRAAASMVRAAGRGAVGAEKAAAVLTGDGSLAEMWPVTRQLFSDAARRQMLAPHLRRTGDAYAAILQRAYDAAPSATFHARVSFAEARAYMHDVLLRDTDQMSMAHGLEVRVPLLDHRLASFVAALPDEWMTSGRPKSLLIESLERPLPEAIVGAPKRGFVLPFETWMRGSLRRFCELQLGEQGIDGRDLLVPGEGRRLWTRFLAGSPGVTWARVWALVALNAWLERRAL